MKSVIKLQCRNMDDHSFNKILEVCSWEEGLDDKELDSYAIRETLLKR